MVHPEISIVLYTLRSLLEEYGTLSELKVNSLNRLEDRGK